MKTTRAIILALAAGCSPLGERTLPDFVEQVDATGAPDAAGALDASDLTDAARPSDAVVSADAPTTRDAMAVRDASLDAQGMTEDAEKPALDADVAPDTALAVDATAAVPEAGPSDGPPAPPAADAQVDDACLNSCLPCGGDLALDQDGDGVRACEGDCDDLDPSRSLGRVELCNGVDDDCDGAIDEPYVELGQPCRVGRGACARAATFVCNPGTTEIECGIAPGAPADEGCNDVDDDCDDRVDEGARNACGACGPVPLEVCDGQDNDCDGAVDDGVRNACGGCGAVPMEVCNGQDDNCDGQVDNGILNACGLCGLTPVEVCDGQDNDCDGVVDDGLLNCCTPGQTVACGSDVGACAEGLQTCDANRVYGPCVGAVGPSLEACDSRDNDCDTRTDEGVQNACGLCGALPSEVCNLRDDDCDRRIDEGVQNACGGCGAVPREVCDGRDNDCDFQTDEGVLNACGLCGELPAEVCDGRDNDCDRSVDEEILPDGCEYDENGCTYGGETTCVDGERGCRATSLLGGRCPEVCNGLDDDGDRTIDNIRATACVRRFDDGPIYECMGVLRCFGGSEFCGPQIGVLDKCNGVDEDCDGLFDENGGLCEVQ